MSDPKNQSDPKPSKKESKQLITVRLDQETIARIEKHRERISTTYHKCTRTDAVRMLIAHSLPRFEEQNRQAKAEREKASATATKREHRPARKPRS